MPRGSQPAGKPSLPNDPLTGKVGPVMERVDKFWNRVTEGMQVGELWKQFQTDARSSYRLYSKEVDAERVQGVSKGKHFLDVAGQFFWAILEKLSPARRVLLLIALVLILFPSGHAEWQSGNGGVSINLDTH